MVNKLYLFPVLMIISGLIFSCSISITDDQSAKGGVFTIDNTLLDDKRVLSLAGEWEFFPGRYLSPSELPDFSGKNGTGTGNSRFVQVPGFWDTLESEPLPPKNVGTYRLILKGLEPGEVISFWITDVWSGYNLYADGQLVNSCGFVGKTKNIENTRLKSLVFVPDSTEAELVLQVSNFINPHGGFIGVIAIGAVQSVTMLGNQQIAQKIAVVFFIMILGLSQLIYFMNNPKQLVSLFFALFCILIATRTLVIQSYLPDMFIPGNNMALYVRISYFAGILMPPAGLLFALYLYPSPRMKKIFIGLAAAGVLMSVIVVFNLEVMIGAYYSVIQYSLFIYLAAIGYLFIHALWRRYDGIYISIIGFFIFVFMIVIDWLGYNTIVDISFKGFTSIGMIVFLVSHAVILARQNERMYQAVVDLTENLEERVQRRTLQLQNRNLQLESITQELQETQSKLMLNDKITAVGSLSAGLSHELKNPFNYISNFADIAMLFLRNLNAMLFSGNVKFSQQEHHEADTIVKEISQSIIMVQKHCGRAEEILNTMCYSTSSLDEIELVSVDPEKLVNQALYLATHGIQLFDRTFSIDTVTDFTSQVTRIMANPDALGRALLNIITNSCEAAYKNHKQLLNKTQPQVKITTEVTDGMYCISITDNGPGIPAHNLTKVFDPFFTTKQPGMGSGLGLSIAWDIIVNQHDGDLEVTSTGSQGTTVSVRIPAVVSPQEEDTILPGQITDQQ
jgi:signal transduction histidine kinase